MKFFNVHTHLPPRPDEETIRCCGLHPWNIKSNWRYLLNLFLGPLYVPGFEPKEILQAIGECGLDHVCQTPYNLQLEAFKVQITESEHRQLPLILHCVRAQDDVLQLKQHTTQPWVWHGFRGKPEQLQQLIQHGFYVSFGLHYNAESLARCPAEKLFLETDKEDTPIRLLYDEAARLRNTTVETLKQQLWANASAIFGNLKQ